MHPACAPIPSREKVKIREVVHLLLQCPLDLNMHPSQHVRELLISDPPTKSPRGTYPVQLAVIVQPYNQKLGAIRCASNG